jgi:hypothetical protein
LIWINVRENRPWHPPSVIWRLGADPLWSMTSGMTLMERPRPGIESATTLQAGGVLATSFGAVWYLSLMRPVWAAASFGPICGHQNVLVAHCPGCYAAVALMAVGLGLILSPSIQRRSMQPAASRRPPR